MYVEPWYILTYGESFVAIVLESYILMLEYGTTRMEFSVGHTKSHVGFTILSPNSIEYSDNLNPTSVVPPDQFFC